jgi:hypothetical protein
VTLAATVLMKWTGGQWMTGNPLLLLSVMLEVMGVQFLSLGLIGEVLTRVYFERQGRRPYAIRESRAPVVIREAVLPISEFHEAA